MRIRKYAAQIRNSATVSHPTSDAFSVSEFVAPTTADGTISFVLLAAA